MLWRGREHASRCMLSAPAAMATLRSSAAIAAGNRVRFAAKVDIVLDTNDDGARHEGYLCEMHGLCMCVCVCVWGEREREREV